MGSLSMRALTLRPAVRFAGLLAILTGFVVVPVGAQIGTDLCACSPAVYTFELIFDATCDSRDEVVYAAKIWLIGQDTPNRTDTPSRCIQTSSTDEILSALKDASDEVENALHTEAVLDAVKTGIEQGWQASLQSRVPRECF